MAETDSDSQNHSGNENEDSFPPLSSGESGQDSAEGLEELGSEIGPYRLVEVLGKGGYGVVYLAEEKRHIKRRVALKVIKPGMDTEQVMARFEAERQALAFLDHPNIARIYGAGTTDRGRPYFVMELIDGPPITEYCDQHRLGIEERLKLFVQICQAVQYAHQKGIIHRDLKPSNILIVLQYQEPVPKVIDFGIVKALNQPLTERALHTKEGQSIGTPAYMSPEQAEGANEDIDTRSDIYSLGVVLYELLSGTLPFEGGILREGDIDQVRHILRNEEPQTPSAQLTKLGEGARAIAERRTTDLVTLSKRLRRELEWIPLKAIRKEPDRRYQTVSDLADDVQNYLQGSPLEAGPESVAYRMRKFIRRHAILLAGITAVLGILLVATSISIVMHLIADRQRQLAHELERESQQQMYNSMISLADEYCGQDNGRRAYQSLNSCPVDLRQWEWCYLCRLASQHLMTLNGEDPAPVRFLQYSPDGRSVVTSSMLSGLRVWDSQTGVSNRGLPFMSQSFAFSPDGSRIAIAAAGRVTVVETHSYTSLLTLQKPEREVISVAFSPDGQNIASGGRDGTITIWDAIGGAEIMTFNGHRSLVLSLAFGPDGSRIVSGGISGSIIVWNVLDGRQVAVFKKERREERLVAFTPDGTRIISHGEGGFLRTREIEGGTEHSVRVGGVMTAISPGGRSVAFRDKEQIRIWNVETNSESYAFGTDDSLGVVLAFSWDQKEIALGSRSSGTVTIRGIGCGKPVVIVPEQQLINTVAFSPDSRRIVSGGDGNWLTLRDAVNGKEIVRLRGHTEEIHSAAFSPDGRHIVSGSADGTVKIWDSNSGAELSSLHGRGTDVYCVAFHPDGRRIVWGSFDLVVGDTSTASEVLTVQAPHWDDGHGGPIFAVACSWDGRLIASGGDNGAIKIWDASTGSEIRVLTGHKNEVRALAFVDDDHRIVSGSCDGTMKIWDISSGRELRTLAGHQGWILSLSTSPNGQRIVSGGQDGTLRLWNVETGNQVISLSAQEDEVSSVAFSPDGKHIASSGHGKTLKVWTP